MAAHRDTHRSESRTFNSRNKHLKRSKMNLETQTKAETPKHMTSKTKSTPVNRRINSLVFSSPGGKSCVFGVRISVKQPADKVHVCEECGYAASQHSRLEQHMLTHSGEKVFRCKHCQSAFKRSHYLKRHMRIHTGEKPYCCKDCGASFTHYYSWHIHIKTHTGEKPHLCVQCGFAFSEPSNLQRHMQTHTGERPFLCSQCGLAFARAGNLKTHMRVHTGEKPFSCLRCKATFSRLTNMELHMRSHTGEKPFQCQECGAKLSSSGALKTHRRIHTGEKPFSCRGCDASFRQISHLQKHVKIHHAGQQWVSDKQSKNKQVGSNTTKRADHTSSDCHKSSQNTDLITVTSQNSNNENVASKTYPKQGSLERHQPSVPQRNTVQGLSMAEQICLQTLVSIHSQEMPSQGSQMENPAPLLSNKKSVSFASLVPNVPQTCNTQVQNVTLFPLQEQLVQNANPGLNSGTVNKMSPIPPYHSNKGHESSSLSVLTQMSAECQLMTSSGLSNQAKTSSENLSGSCAESSSDQHLMVYRQTGQLVVDVKTGNGQHLTLGSEHQHVPAMYSGGGQDLLLYGHTSERGPPEEKQCQQLLEPKKYERPNSCGATALTNLSAGQMVVDSGIRESGCDEKVSPVQGDKAFLHCGITESGCDEKVSPVRGDKAHLADELYSQANSGEDGHHFLESIAVPTAKPASGERMPFQTAKREVSVESPGSDSDSEYMENCPEGLSFQGEDSDLASSRPHDLQEDVQWKAHVKQSCQNTKPTSSSGVETNGASRNRNSVAEQQPDQSTICSETTAEAVFPKANRREETVEENNIADPEKDCTNPSDMITHLSMPGYVSGKDTVPSCTTTNPNNRAKEMKSQMTNKPFLCSQCGTAFSRAGNLKTHMAIHTGEKPYSCTHCQSSFNRPWNLKLHMRSHTGEKPFLCKHCGTRFGTAGALKTHTRIHTGEKPFSCHDCGSTFRLMRQLQKHIVVQHSSWSAGSISWTGPHSGKRPFSCTECSATFRCKNSLQIHKKTHTKQKSYQCKECDCSFTERSNLQRHLSTHTGERPFLCAQCGAVFARAGNLKSHMSVHTGDRPFTCRKCNAKFNRSWNLKLHLRSHTGEKAFPCHQCGANLSSAGALKTHTRIHTGEKPFVCTNCGTAFRQTGQLQKHIRIHHTFIGF